MTEEQVLNKLTTLCARGEHCQQEMLDKMRRWEIDESTQAHVMEYLLKEKYIDEERPSSIYNPILDEVDEKNYEEILRPLLEAKRKTVTGKSEYEIRGKLIRFALSRGFEMDEILKIL